MQIAHGDEVPVVCDGGGVRTGKVGKQFLLSGDPASPGNFKFGLFHQYGDFYSPRHRHNFCQFRVQLEGLCEYGLSGKMKPGTVGYFPEGAITVRRGRTEDTYTATLQFGGPSGSGLLTPEQTAAAKKELLKFGTFEKGVFRPNPEVSDRRNMDGFEAVWEHINGRKLVYPEPQYAAPVMMHPDSYQWMPVPARAAWRRRSWESSPTARSRARSIACSRARRLRHRGAGSSWSCRAMARWRATRSASTRRSISTPVKPLGFEADEVSEILLLGMPDVASIEKYAPAEVAQRGSSGNRLRQMPTQLLINGQFVPAAAGRTFTRANPLDGTVATEAAAADPADARKAADAAQAAFPKWAALGPNARRALLNKAADSLAAKAPELIAAMQAEIGATQAWAGFNIYLATGMIREAAALTTQISGTVIPSDKPGCMAMAIREPAGVVLGMAPWNAPVILGVRAIATPLACGNTVVLKASETCPRTHALIGAAFHEAGLPEGVVNVITNAAADAPDVVGALIAHPAVRRVNFTGSTRVGPDCRGVVRAPAQARRSGTGRQGPAAGAPRRRSGRGGQGRGVRRVHEPGADLHVDRADHCGRFGGRRIRRAVQRQGEDAGGRRSAGRQDAAGRAGRSGMRRSTCAIWWPMRSAWAARLRPAAMARAC
jgi:hypothetical protein